MRVMQAIQGIDVLHQLYRLRHTKNMPDAEVELIMRTFADNVQSYEQVVEVGLIYWFYLEDFHVCVLAALVTGLHDSFWRRITASQFRTLPPTRVGS